MLESFFNAFIAYFMVIDPVGNAPIFHAVTEAQDLARKLRTALEGTTIATTVILFVALCRAWILAYPNINEVEFKIAGSNNGTKGKNDSGSDSLAIYPLAILPLVGPSATMSAGAPSGFVKSRLLSRTRSFLVSDILTAPPPF